MRQINTILTLYSLTALVIIVERLSFTTKLLLSPYNFTTLHELNQTTIFLSTSVILSVFVLKSVTNNFQTLKTLKNTILFVLFAAGTYLYGAGEGWHEVASFTLNRYCHVNHVMGNLCGGLFINDYYAGNIIFFIGGVLASTALLSFAAQQKEKKFNKSELMILIINSIVYAFTWFAYAAFDKVLIGLIFSAILLAISLYFSFRVQFKLKEYPYITYSVIAYTLATVGTIIVRFH